MTPIEYFIIFYGTEQRKSSLHNVRTLDNTTTTYVISGIVAAGNYIVGVSAVNSAGRSTVTLYEEHLGKHNYCVIIIGMYMYHVHVLWLVGCVCVRERESEGDC